MKLSKEILYNAFIAASNIVKPHGDWFKLMRNAAEALDSGTLEIEGYVREDHIADDSKKVEEWTKFDPNDPKTFPPEATSVLFCQIHFDARDSELRRLIGVGWHNPQNHLFWSGQIPVNHKDITHWRPLPEPPKVGISKTETPTPQTEGVK